jgi:hexosaminidase
MQDMRIFARARTIATALLVLPLLASCASNGSSWFEQQTRGWFSRTPETLALIPYPAQVVPASGEFAVTADTPLLYPAGDRGAQFAAGYFADILKKTRGIVLAPREGVPAPGTIAFTTSPDNSGKEHYTLDVASGGVTISAGSPAGALYGGITLWQLLTQTPGPAPSVMLHAVHIDDAPRFAWRGLLLDSVRHYQTPEFVKTLIDAMAREKLNVLQWHLTDDQGWRLEIKKYPRLTQIGAWRVPAGDAAKHDIDPATGKPRLYGGFYTQDQVRDIVAYAAERNITIVPEIEMPGHAMAAIVAYPKLGSLKKPPTDVSGDWGVFPYLYNVDDQTFGFLEDVLTETMALFPSTYIHVGGDEAVKDQWQASPRIQSQMKKLGLANEDAMQSWFIQRIEKFLNAHGRRLIGWDEILQGGVAPNATITSWRGIDGAVTAAKLGHDAVLSPAPTLYLDNRQAEGPNEPPGRALIVTLADVYNFDPASASLTDEQKKHIIGVQANIWTEHIRTDDRVAYAAFPRTAALAEVAWSPAAAHDEANFLARVPAELDRYTALGLPHSTSAFDVRMDATANAKGGLTVSLANQAGLGEVHYSLDGTAPTPDSTLYAAPVDIPLPSHLRAVAFLGPRPLGEPLEQDLNSTTLSRRDSHELKLCSKNITLSLEGQVPLSGKRPVFLVDAMGPCWIWEKAPLDGVTGVAVSGEELPFNFQIGKDIAKVVMPPASTPDGEFEIHLDSCTGPKIGSLPMPHPDPADVLDAVRGPITAQTGTHDLCFFFTRPSLDPFWALHTVQLLSGQ